MQRQGAKLPRRHRNHFKDCLQRQDCRRQKRRKSAYRKTLRKHLLAQARLPVALAWHRKP
jgi:hypothetical protein